jgi:hypothetical protein
MTDQTRLEHRYRRLLAFYPRTFCAEHEEEMLVVLLACARDGRRRAGVADAVNLLVNALRVRLRSGAPRSIPAVLWGVRLMLVCAVLELVAALTVLVTGGVLDRAIARRFPQLPSGQVSSLVGAHTLPVLVGAPIAAGLWLLLAWANHRGRRWARAGVIALAGLSLLSLLAAIANHAATLAVADFVSGAVLCTVSLTAAGLIASHTADPHYSGKGGGSRSALPAWPRHSPLVSGN